MYRILTAICIFTISAGCFVTSQRVIAQDDELRQSELGARQRLVERKMIELENQFTAIAEKIREEDPERAERLVEVYQRAKETLITKKMAEVSRLLDEGELDAAELEVGVVITRLNDLVRMLLNNQPDKINKQEQIAQYEQWKKTIQDVRREQTSQRKETGKVADKESELKKLDRQLKILDELIQRQADLIDQTKAAENAGLRAMDKVADKQFELRKKTDNLRKDVSGELNDGSQTGTDSDNQDSSSKPGENQNPEGKTDSNSSKQNAESNQQENSQQDEIENASDDNSGNTGRPEKPDGQSDQPQSDEEPQSGQQQDDQQKNSQDGSGEQQAENQQSGEQQSGEQQSGEQQNQESQPGQQRLKQASKSQEKAEEKLGSGRPKDAKRQQEKALADLEKAKSELKKERRRLASLPPEAIEQMARKQRRTRDKAMDLVEKMAKTPTAEESAEEQPVSQQNPQQQPGQQQMQQASDAMENASKNLDEQEPKKAERKQREAEKKLEEALEEIEERLNQLRDETREEKLRRLEGRFSEMLDRQRAASAMTIEIEDKKVNLGKLQRRDQLVVLRLATEEIEISELGQQAYDLLLEDGTSDVFPELVHDLVDSLTNAGQMLQSERTDQLTQLLQQEIESALMDLLEALEESKEEGGQQGGGGGGGGDQPLLKRSAELKMLKAAQLRLNRKTRQLDNIKGSQQIESDQSLDQEIDGLSVLQAKLQEMAEQIMEKNN